MVLQHSGVEVDKDALTALVYLPDRRGSITTEMLAAPRGFERIAYPLPGRLDALESSLAQGHPPLVLLNLGLSWWPVWHYAVLTGSGPDAMWLHSGTEAGLRVERSVFARQWRRAGRWSALVLPPDIAPRALSAGAILETLAPLEHSHARLVAPAYHAALSLYPGDAGLRFGWANALDRAGTPERAREVLESLLEEQPGHRAILNNLALLMDRSGERDQALRLIDATLADTSAEDPWHSTLLDTRSKLRANRCDQYRSASPWQDDACTISGSP